MQTFLPFPNIYRSASILDDKRLNKQIVEAFQVYTGRVPNLNHPACLMWEKYKPFLRQYIHACCREYSLRFGKQHSVDMELSRVPVIDAPRPWWFRNNLFHHTHKVNLLRKNREFYKDFESFTISYGDEPEGYYWPVAKEGGKAWKDSQNWAAWAREHRFPYEETEM